MRQSSWIGRLYKKLVLRCIFHVSHCVLFVYFLCFIFYTILYLFEFKWFNFFVKVYRCVFTIQSRTLFRFSSQIGKIIN